MLDERQRDARHRDEVELRVLVGVLKVADEVADRRDRRGLGHAPALHDAEPVPLLVGGDHRARDGGASDEHPLHVGQVPLAGVRVEHLQHPEPDRRHAGRPGHLLLDEVLEQALGVEVRAGEDELRAEHGRQVRVAPRVRVEHRHHRQQRVAVRDAQAERRGRRDAERVQDGRAVRVDDALAAPGRPAREAHRGRLALVELRVLPLVRARGRRAAPRRSPRRRRRARSSSAPGTARAGAGGCGRRSRPCRRRDRRRRPGRRGADGGSACGARSRRTGSRSTPPGAGSGSSTASRRGRRARVRASGGRRRAALRGRPCRGTCSGGSSCPGAS